MRPNWSLGLHGSAFPIVSTQDQAPLGDLAIAGEAIEAEAGSDGMLTATAPTAPGDSGSVTSGTWSVQEMVAGDLVRYVQDLEEKLAELRARGAEEHEIAFTLHVLGSLRLATGDDTSARQHFEDCMHARRSCGGSHHLEVAKAFAVLGQVSLGKDVRPGASLEEQKGISKVSTVAGACAGFACFLLLTICGPFYITPDVFATSSLLAAAVVVLLEVLLAAPGMPWLKGPVRWGRSSLLLVLWAAFFACALGVPDPLNQQGQVERGVRSSVKRGGYLSFALDSIDWIPA